MDEKDIGDKFYGIGNARRHANIANAPEACYVPWSAPSPWPGPSESLNGFARGQRRLFEETLRLAE